MILNIEMDIARDWVFADKAHTDNEPISAERFDDGAVDPLLYCDVCGIHYDIETSCEYY